MEVARWIAELVKWAIELGLAFVNGDEGPEPQRLADVLPPKLRADGEHLRQRRMLEADIRADIAREASSDEDS